MGMGLNPLTGKLDLVGWQPNSDTQEALANANTPSSTNPFATMDDINTAISTLVTNNRLLVFNNGSAVTNSDIRVAVRSVTAGNANAKTLDITAEGFTTIFGVFAIAERNSTTIGEIDTIALRSVTSTAVNYTLTRSTGLVTILSIVVDGSGHDNTQTNTVRFLIIGV